MKTSENAGEEDRESKPDAMEPSLIAEAISIVKTSNEQ
jgi:hypothetical protein